MKISVVINTYNAQKHLQQVLESVKQFDEIVICDMYSTDNTIPIAQKFGCTICYHQKLSFVEPARNFAIQSAKHHWVLLLDADEVVTPQLKDYLYQLINTPNCPEGLKIARKNYFMGRFMHSAYPDYCLRFFKKDKVNYPAFIHVQPEIKGRIDKINANDKQLAFEHLANDSITDILEKTNTYTTQEIAKRKNKKITGFKLLFSPFFWFFKYYFIKGAIRDGKAGFIFSVLKSFYKFSTLAKILEYKTNP